MHQALYRKWRPKTFDDVWGQEHVTDVLAYQSQNDKFNHAYLFCGSRGTGKTTCAKILAKAANCRHKINGNPCNECDTCKAIDAGTSVEVLEMDAASNTGVDYIRDIREEVVFSPTEMGTRVYIIDEVHMLSESAFNALLKTLEEPPAGVIFVLATTELQKIPATILSRCQRYDFRRIPVQVIVNRLNYIAENEKITIDPEAAALIARLAQGGMRDAISMLELCAGNSGDVTLESVYNAAGLCGSQVIEEVIRAVLHRDYLGVLRSVSRIHRSASDLTVFLSDLMGYYRDMLIRKTLNLTSLDQQSRELLDLSDSEFARLCELSDQFRRETMLYHIKLLEDAILSMNRGADKRVTAETVLLRMCGGVYDESIEALNERIGALEARLTSLAAGSFTPVKNENPAEKTADVSMAVVKEEPEKAAAFETKSAEKEAFSSWVEVVDRYEEVDKSVTPFLRAATAYMDGETLVVTVPDAFSQKMLAGMNTEKKLLGLMKADGYALEKVKVTVGEKPKQKTIFDDII